MKMWQKALSVIIILAAAVPFLSREQKTRWAKAQRANTFIKGKLLQAFIGFQVFLLVNTAEPVQRYAQCF